MQDLPSLDLQPIQTNKDSKDTLPLRGYSEEQLASYIKRKLGAPTWNVELTQQSILDAIQDAMSKYSLYKPLHQWGAISLVAGQKKYLDHMDVGQGIAELTFVENRIGVINMDFGNPFVAMSVMTTGLGLDGVGDFDSYLRWQSTWQRVTSTAPQWQWDEPRKCLWIHNPIARYRASVLVYKNWPSTSELPAFGCDWVKEYALAVARYQTGDLWMKFSGAIPGPVKDIQMDSAKRDKAQEEITKLEQKLIESMDTVPIQVD